MSMHYCHTDKKTSLIPIPYIDKLKSHKSTNAVSEQQNSNPSQQRYRINRLNQATKTVNQSGVQHQNPNT